MLAVGLVGLPNVGKSTLFSALTAHEAAVSNYPFTTIDSNVGVVEAPDDRLAELAGLLEPEECVPSAIELVDVAGLVEGASRGEGLGNQFLGNLRAVDAVAHVVRCFEDEGVAHVFGGVDPVRDAAVVDTELVLADLEIVERAIAKRHKLWATDPRGSEGERLRLTSFAERLGAGETLRGTADGREEATELKALGLLTAKPLLYVANTAEGADPEPCVARLRDHAAGTPVVSICADLEWQLLQFPEEERREFAAELGLEEPGLDRLARATFDLLDLVRFYTLVNDKLRAWAVPRGTPAPHAAGRIHSDMEQGFIRARVATCADLLEHGDMHALHDLGKVRTEGRDYQVLDGDVIEFVFSV